MKPNRTQRTSLVGVALALLVGASCTEDVGTSVRISLVYKDGWKMASADVVTSRDEVQLEKNAPIAHQILVLIPDELAGEVMPLDVWGVRDGERISHGSAVALPRKGDTVEATIVLDRLPCGVFCTPGDLQCDGGGLSTCGPDADGCLVWGDPKACPSEAPFCSAGVCSKDCSDECAAGQSECVDAANERRCGEFDNDTCLDFGSKTACGAGQVCYGGRCAAPCTLGALANSALADSATPFGPAIAIDAGGTSHAVYSVTGTRQLRYAYRPAGGAWSAWQNIPGGIGENPALFADKLGGLHLSYGGTALVYGYRPAGAASTWMLKTLDTGTGIGDSSSVAVDEAGAVHIVYHVPGTTHVLRHTSSPTWSVEDIDIDIGLGCDLVIVGNTLHVSSLSYLNNLWYSVREPGQAWSTTMIHDLTGTVAYANAGTSIAADRNGTLHLVYSDLYTGFDLTRDDDLRYLYKSGASWTTTPVIIDNRNMLTGSYPDLVVDPFDRLHVAYRTTAATPTLQYAYKDAGTTSPWVITSQPPATSGSQPSIAAGPDGGVHILSGAASVIETARACQ